MYTNSFSPRVSMGSRRCPRFRYLVLALVATTSLTLVEHTSAVFTSFATADQQDDVQFDDGRSTMMALGAAADDFALNVAAVNTTGAPNNSTTSATSAETTVAPSASSFSSVRAPEDEHVSKTAAIITCSALAVLTGSASSLSVIQLAAMLDAMPCRGVGSRNGGSSSSTSSSGSSSNASSSWSSVIANLFSGDADVDSSTRLANGLVHYKYLSDQSFTRRILTPLKITNFDEMRFLYASFIIVGSCIALYAVIYTMAVKFLGGMFARAFLLFPRPVVFVVVFMFPGIASEGFRLLVGLDNSADNVTEETKVTFADRISGASGVFFCVLVILAHHFVIVWYRPPKIKRFLGANNAAAVLDTKGRVDDDGSEEELRVITSSSPLEGGRDEAGAASVTVAPAGYEGQVGEEEDITVIDLTRSYSDRFKEEESATTTMDYDVGDALPPLPHQICRQGPASTQQRRSNAATLPPKRSAQQRGSHGEQQQQQGGGGPSSHIVPITAAYNINNTSIADDEEEHRQQPQHDEPRRHHHHHHHAHHRHRRGSKWPAYDPLHFSPSQAFLSSGSPITQSIDGGPLSLGGGIGVGGALQSTSSAAVTVVSNPFGKQIVSIAGSPNASYAASGFGGYPPNANGRSAPRVSIDTPPQFNASSPGAPHNRGEKRGNGAGTVMADARLPSLALSPPASFRGARREQRAKRSSGGKRSSGAGGSSGSFSSAHTLMDPREWAMQYFGLNYFSGAFNGPDGALADDTDVAPITMATAGVDAGDYSGSMSPFALALGVPQNRRGPALGSNNQRLRNAAVSVQHQQTTLRKMESSVHPLLGQSNHNTNRAVLSARRQRIMALSRSNANLLADGALTGEVDPSSAVSGASSSSNPMFAANQKAKGAAAAAALVMDSDGNSVDGNAPRGGWRGQQQQQGGSQSKGDGTVMSHLVEANYKLEQFFSNQNLFVRTSRWLSQKTGRTLQPTDPIVLHTPKGPIELFPRQSAIDPAYLVQPNHNSGYGTLYALFTARQRRAHYNFLTDLFLAPKGQWVARLHQSFFCVAADLFRPRCLVVMVSWNLVRTLAFAGVTMYTPAATGRCDMVQWGAALVAFFYALLLLLTFVYRIPVLNLLQVSESALLGLYAAAPVLGWEGITKTRAVMAITALPATASTIAATVSATSSAVSLLPNSTTTEPPQTMLFEEEVTTVIEATTIIYYCILAVVALGGVLRLLAMYFETTLMISIVRRRTSLEWDRFNPPRFRKVVLGPSATNHSAATMKKTSASFSSSFSTTLAGSAATARQQKISARLLYKGLAASQPANIAAHRVFTFETMFVRNEMILSPPMETDLVAKAVETLRLQERQPQRDRRECEKSNPTAEDVGARDRSAVGSVVDPNSSSRYQGDSILVAQAGEDFSHGGQDPRRIIARQQAKSRLVSEQRRMRDENDYYDEDDDGYSGYYSANGAGSPRSQADGGEELIPIHVGGGGGANTDDELEPQNDMDHRDGGGGYRSAASSVIVRSGMHNTIKSVSKVLLALKDQNKAHHQLQRQYNSSANYYASSPSPTRAVPPHPPPHPPPAVVVRGGDGGAGTPSVSPIPPSASASATPPPADSSSTNAPPLPPPSGRRVSSLSADELVPQQHQQHQQQNAHQADHSSPHNVFGANVFSLDASDDDYSSPKVARRRLPNGPTNDPPLPSSAPSTTAGGGGIPSNAPPSPPADLTKIAKKLRGLQASVTYANDKGPRAVVTGWGGWAAAVPPAGDDEEGNGFDDVVAIGKGDDGYGDDDHNAYFGEGDRFADGSNNRNGLSGGGSGGSFLPHPPPEEEEEDIAIDMQAVNDSMWF